MTGLIIAMGREAAPFLARAGLTPPAKETYPLFFDLRPSARVVVCICGMGPGQAREGCTRLLQEYEVSTVVNAGAAGGLRDDVDAGGVYRISDTWLWPQVEPAYNCGSNMFAQLPAATIVTVDKPVFNKVLRRELGRNAHLVDMECAALARECAVRGVPFHAVKGVTDMASRSDRKTLLANIDRVCEKLAGLVWRALE